jgi:hypothetical protein
MNVTDTAGWGAAEWIALATVVSILIGAIVGAIVQLSRLRRENSDQHAEGRALVTDVRDRLLNLHEAVDRVDEKVEGVADRLERHESVHHRGRRRW